MLTSNVCIKGDEGNGLVLICPGSFPKIRKVLERNNAHDFIELAPETVGPSFCYLHLISDRNKPDITQRHVSIDIVVYSSVGAGKVRLCVVKETGELVLII